MTGPHSPSEEDTQASDEPLVGDSRFTKAQSSQAWSYFLTVVLGLIPVFFEPEGLWWLPTVLMIGYLYFGHSKAQASGLLFEFADSFYYLGFTLSIGSLLASLHPFNPATELHAKEELRFFGLGMLSTLVGVVGRSVMQIYHRSPGESIATLNHSIEEEAARFLKGLSALQRAAEASLRQMESAASKSAEVINSTVESDLSRSANAITTFADRVEGMATAAGTLVPDVSQVHASFGTMAKSLDEWAKRTGELRRQMEEAHSERLRVADAAAAEIAQAQQRMTSTLTRTTTDVTSVVGGLRDAAQALSAMKFDDARLASAIAGAAISVERAAADTAGSLGALRGLVDQYGRSVANLAGLLSVEEARGLQDAVQAVKDALTTLGHDLKQQSESVSIDGLRPLGAALKDVGGGVSELNKLLDDIAAAVQVRLSRL